MNFKTFEALHEEFDVDKDVVLSEEQMLALKPYAMFVSMLHGNAFFDLDDVFWKQYCVEAYAVLKANSCLDLLEKPTS